jgi:hypothetical protein
VFICHCEARSDVAIPKSLSSVILSEAKDLGHSQSLLIEILRSLRSLRMAESEGLAMTGRRAME